jgi:hypothetical protein
VIELEASRIGVGDYDVRNQRGKGGARRPHGWQESWRKDGAVIFSITLLKAIL